MARYQDAIDWIAYNDDCTFVDPPAGFSGYSLSMTATLVMDLWGKTEDDVRADLRKAIARATRERALSQ